MVCLPGIDSKSYWTRLARGRAIREVACPDPSCPGLLAARGWYGRYLGGERVQLRRLLCGGCGVSHALLPEDVCAYQDLTLPALEAAMHHRAGPSAAARAAAGFRHGAQGSPMAAWLELASPARPAANAGKRLGADPGDRRRGSGPADASAALAVVQAGLVPRWTGRIVSSRPPRGGFPGCCSISW